MLRRGLVSRLSLCALALAAGGCTDTSNPKGTAAPAHDVSGDVPGPAGDAGLPPDAGPDTATLPDTGPASDTSPLPDTGPTPDTSALPDAADGAEPSDAPDASDAEPDAVPPLCEAEGSPCDDGNPCTLDDVCQGGLCVGTSSVECAGDAPDACHLAPACNPQTGNCEPPSAPDGTACDDGDPCTLVDACLAGMCSSAPPCDDGNACTDDVCTEGACNHYPLEGTCDDGKGCTTDDTCVAGVCVGTPPGQCVDGNPCTDDGCDDQGCVATPRDGPCDDGDACTTGGACVAGACVSDGAVDCDDTNPCTDDTCDPALGCAHMPNQHPCDDGTACTTGDACAGGSCAGAPLSCDDGSPCTQDACNASSGCTHFQIVGACDDGDPCTQGETCVGTTCVVGTVTDCNDDNNCTDDTCDAAGACVHTPTTAPCDDGDKCTQDDVCADGACAAGAALDCGDGDPCTADLCNPATGCFHPALDGACDDGNPCTGPGQCAGGSCQAGAPSSCDDGIDCTADGCDPASGCVHTAQPGPCGDGDPCTDDVCDPASGCKHTHNTALCDDKNPCTTSDTCAAGTCVGGPPPDCGDADACTTDTCDPASGCAHAPAPPCDDGNACTVDTCDPATGCVFTAGAPCDDGNPCTADGCDPLAGCVHPPKAGPCDDGNPCTSGDTCTAGTCAGHTATHCDDNNVCTADSCDPATGCVHTPQAGTCDDGNACTQGDTCSGGTCTGGSPTVCTATAPCHLVGTCDPATGTCSNPVAAAGAPCTDGNACTQSDTCDGAGHCVGATPVVCQALGACMEPGPCDPSSGKCAPYPSLAGTPCSDGNACTQTDACDGAGTCVGTHPVACVAKDVCHTAGACDPATGTCSAPPAPLGAPCDDGSVCTAVDYCDGLGSCTGGLPVPCDDGNVCTDDACDPLTGCTHTPNAAPCDDGSACSTDEVCADGVCASPNPGCDDGNPCTTDTCDDVLGCSHVPNAALCDDGSACTTGDRCAAGTCGGIPLVCMDGNPCTDDLCDPATGCTFPNNTDPCDDGDACTAGDVCTGGTCTPAGPTDCDDANPCTDDSCNAATGCAHANNRAVYGTCTTGHPGVCGAGRYRCQDGASYCFPETPDVGLQELVEVPDGLVDQWTGQPAPGWAMITSDGQTIVNVSFGLGGTPYAGWTWKRFDPTRGFALVDSGEIATTSFYIDGVIADDTGIYLTEWTGLDAPTRVARLDPAAHTVEDVGSIPGNGPITGQYDWTNGKVWMGNLWGGTAYRWAGEPWAPLPTNIEDHLTLQSVGGAGVLATDGVYLYVKRWAFYPGNDWVRRVGTGFHGTVAGQYYGFLNTDFTPVPYNLAAAYHSDGYLYMPVHDPYRINRMRATGAHVEVCNGQDDDCDGPVDESCEAPNDRCLGATPLADGPNTLDLAHAGGPDGADECGIGAGADLWYRGVASCTGVVAVTSCGSGQDTRLALYRGDDCDVAVFGGGACGLAGCGDGRTATLGLVAGAPFLLRVGGAGGGTTTVTVSCGANVCGDGVLAAGEECDDGNLAPGDGCDGSCKREFCGDGIVQYGLKEVCDAGAQNDDIAPGACRTSCAQAGCGDGVVDPGEDCDLGPFNSNTQPDTCRAGCQKPACGDGVLDTGEQCDDGNIQSEDGCSALCATESCGDGVIQAGLGEECDDHNTASGDGCGPKCTREICGDGIKQAALGEECDRGKNGDATCDSHCKLRVCSTEICNGVDDDCDGVVDEGCVGFAVSSVQLDGSPIVVQVPDACQNEFDCNDQSNGTVDDCVNGHCTHTYVGCDGQDADACPDGRRLVTDGPCLNSGPTLLWDFDGLGLLAVDQSGNGHHGVQVAGGAVVNQGRFGGHGYEPRGLGTVGAEMILPQTDFTLSAWFKTTATDGGLFAGERTTAGASGPRTDREVFIEGGHLGYHVSPGPSSQCTGQGPIVNDGAWHLASLVCQAGSSCRLLLDGARICTSLSWDDRSQVTDQTRFVAGRSEQGGALGGDAIIDQVSVIGVPMSDTEIQTTLMAGLDTPAKGRNLETCNGVDDDCDGQTDESCDDGDACTVGDTCSGGACVPGTQTTCPAAATCQVSYCDRTTGQCSVRPATAGTPCDDQNPCTTNDACDGQGGCLGTPVACGTDTAWFPRGVYDTGDHLLGYGKDIVIYSLNGQLGCIRSIDPAKQYGQWTKVPGTAETWTHSGLLMFGKATPRSPAGDYTCEDTFPMVGTITVGLTIPCSKSSDCEKGEICSDAVCQVPCNTDADCSGGQTCGAKLVCGKPGFSLGGIASLPWPTSGIFKEIGLAPPPINVALPTLTLGWLPGSQLTHLYAPLRPDYKYFVLSGQLTVGIGPNGVPPISLLSKQVNVVVDPFDPLVYISWLGQQNIKDGLDKEWKTHAKTNYQTGKVVDVRAAAIGFSLGGKMLHRANRKVWTGEVDATGALQFMDAINDAHAYTLVDAELTPFNATAGTLRSFKVAVKGAISLGFDPAGDGYDPAQAATHVFNSIFQDEWDDASYSDLDFRMLADADLFVVLPPLPAPIKNPLTGDPVQLRVPLAGATLLVDTTFDNELVAFRARTTDFIDKIIESIPGVPIAPYTAALDLNGFVKRTAGVGRWGVAVDVSLQLYLVDFEGRLRVGEDGLTLDGMIDPGVIKLNPYFELAPFQTKLAFDGEKFCMLKSTPVPGQVAQQDGSVATTDCSVQLCIGKNGFEGSTFSCKPLCLGHTECDAGQACIWGHCAAALQNGAGCVDDGACASKRCYAGFCVECWPGTAECGTDRFCDNAGYCQDKLPLGAPCVNVAGGSVMRNDWCQSGMCDTLCIRCRPKTVVNLPPLSLPWTNTCPAGQYCGDDGMCYPLRDGGVPCLSVKLAGPADGWCQSGDCGGPATLCLECGPDTSNTCGPTQYCDPVTGITCAPRVGDGTVCGTPDACISGHCDFGVTTTGAPLSYCYTPSSIATGQPCYVNASCQSGACRATDGKCSCNGNNALCADGWCDTLGFCQPKWADGHACYSNAECTSGHCSAQGAVPGSCYTQYQTPNGGGCVFDDECASTHCLGAVCVQCKADADCGTHYACVTGACVYIPFCGDGICNGVDTCATCPGDCGQCCGNGVCQAGFGETCDTCASDCGCASGTQCTAGVCTAIPKCGDGVCNGVDTCATCPADCGNCCGNGSCEIGFGETCSSCPADCGACPYCGDGVCNGAEDCTWCPGDCGACLTGACGASTGGNYGCAAGTCKDHPTSCSYSCSVSCCKAQCLPDFWNCCSWGSCDSTCWTTCSNWWCDAL